MKSSQDKNLGAGQPCARFSLRLRRALCAGKLRGIRYMERTRPVTPSEPTTKPLPGWFWTIVIGRRPRFTLVRIVILVVVCVAVFKFVLLPIQIDGPSMLPTYRQKGVNFVNQLAYRNHGPQRGDVVAIRFAGPSIMLMKRVVGLPGETISSTAP